MLEHASRGLVRSRYSKLVPRTGLVGIVPDVPRRSRSVSIPLVLALICVVGVFLSGCSRSSMFPLPGEDTDSKERNSVMRLEDNGGGGCHVLQRWRDTEKNVTCYRVTCKGGIWCMKE